MSDTQTPAATPGISADFSMASIDGTNATARSYPEDSDEHQEPPAKRARMHSDADMASMTHVSSFFFSPLAPPCAVQGVLISLYRLSQVCHSTSRVSCGQSSSSSTDNRWLYLDGLPSARVHYQHLAISFLIIDSSVSEEDERCLPFLASCRPHRAQHSPLPLYREDAHGLVHSRA